MARKDRRPPAARSRYEIEEKPKLAKKARVHGGTLRTYQEQMLRAMRVAEDAELRAMMALFSDTAADEYDATGDATGIYEIYHDYENHVTTARKTRNNDDNFIMPGETIIAVANGGRDANGLPKDVPIAGHRYVVHEFYIAPYGVGVVLNNVDGTPLDNYPYRGYVFAKIRSGEIYFKKDDES